MKNNHEISTDSLDLGINTLGHDTSAAIFKNGELLLAVEEERLNREKHTRQFPIKATELCLKKAKAQIEDVDHVCVSFVPLELVRMRFLKHTLDYFPKANNLMLENTEASKKTLHHEEEIREKLNYPNAIYFFPHHLTHLASSFHCSSFKRSALLSMDGVGEYESTVLGEGNNQEIEIFNDSSTTFPHSIGLLYSAVTDYLGFHHHSDEGKIMGLASYGNSKKYSRSFQEIVVYEDKGKYKLDPEYFSYPFEKGTRVSLKFIDHFGPKRETGDKLTEHHQDIAAALQNTTEDLILHIANYLYNLTSTPNLCISGGVALNCVANSRIMEETKF